MSTPSSNNPRNDNNPTAWQKHGLEVGETLHVGSDCLVRRATSKDGLPVVLKEPLPELAAADEAERLHQELAISGQLEVPGLRKVIELIEEDGRIALVLEDVGGQPLSEVLAAGPLSLERVLSVGAELARTLAGLHTAGVVHGDVSPGNIIVAGKDDRSWLIDLGLARPVIPDPAPPRGYRGTLAYIAPEQTGRTGRVTDARSDLYGLGATLYHCLAGEPPFAATDPASLLHAHLALKPPPLPLSRRRIPEVVSAIVMRLLAKHPEDRYAGALGLALDLERATRELTDSGTVPSFPLAQRDPPARPSLEHGLFGREQHLVALEHAFAEAKQGAAICVAVAGRSGSGKTMLVREFLEIAVRSGAWVGRGKANALESAPFATLARAVSGLVDGLLSESEQQLAAWGKRLRADLGTSATQLAELVPRLKIITGDRKEPSRGKAVSPTEARNQLQYALQRFVCALATPERPVVLFLDDLQWVDSQSISLLQRLLTDAAVHHVLVIGAYRDEEVGSDHPVSLCFDQLREAKARLLEVSLDSLDIPACKELIASMLGDVSEAAVAIARPIHEATGGNPFLVERTVIALHDDGHLRLDVEAGGWAWDPTVFDVLGVSEDVANLLASAIERLPSLTRGLLATAACLGPVFDLGYLAAAAGAGSEDVARGLLPALEERLLTSVLDDADDGTHDTGTRRFRFLHDRIQEAAYAIISDTDRPSTHNAIGMRLQDVFGTEVGDSWLFDIVGQLNLGREVLETTAERLALAELNLRAGLRAEEGVAFDVAAGLLEVAKELLGDAGWEITSELTWNVHRALADTLLLSGQLARTEAIIDEALQHTQEKFARIDLETIRVRLHLFRSDHLKAAETAVHILSELIPDPPRDEAGWQAAGGMELACVEELLADKSIASLADAAPTRDSLVIDESTALRDLTAVASTAPFLFPAVVGRMTRLSIQYGPTDYSAYGYVLFGMLKVALGNPQQGDEFARMGLELNRRQDNPALAPPLHHVYGAFVAHWAHPFQEALEHLLIAYEGALKHGIFDTAGWSAMNIPVIAFARGTVLPTINKWTRECYESCTGLIGYDDAAHVVAFASHVAAALQADEAQIVELEEAGLFRDELEDSLSHYPMALAPLKTLALQQAVILGDLEGAGAELPFLTDPSIELAAGGIVYMTEVAFYESLVCVLDGREAEAAAATLTKNAKRLRAWSETAPANHLYKQLLVEAELAVLEDRARDALDLFERSVDAAETHGILHGGALVLERTAAFHRANGRSRLARTYLRQARDAWVRWGATARVQQLDKAEPSLRRPAPWIARLHSTSADSSDLDLESLGELSRTISAGSGRDDVLRNLIGVLLESAGAERCAFIQEREGELRLAAVGVAGRPPELPTESRALADVTDLAMEPILFAWRTGSEVLLDDANAHPQFGADPWVQKKGIHSVLCVPMKRAEGSFAEIYLEHRATSAFSPHRVGLVRLAASLAVMAMENAELLDEHRSLSEHLGAMVQHRTRELERLYRDHKLILDSVADGVAWIDLEGKITYANPAACRLTGYESTDLVGVDGHAKLHPLGPDGAALPKDQCPSCRADRVASEPVETTLRRRDGTELYIELSAHPLVDDKDHPVGTAVMFRDHTEKRRLEQQLRQAQKLEAVGLFAGGLAHDFNNLLTPILGNIELVSMELQKNDPRLERLGSARKAVIQASGLVRQMLAFSRQSELFLRPIKLTSVIDQAIHFLRRSTDRRVSVVWSPTSYAPVVVGDEGQLNQVLLNLLLNARDAVLGLDSHHDGGPRIEVTLERTGRESSALGKDGSFALLSIRDNGVGMGADVASHIFEPFYTTKEPGAGSGLGLSVAYGIVEQHDGRIECESSPGEGTVFRIWLPERSAADEPVGEAAGDESMTTRAEEGNRATVLVVDDERLVREMAANMLKGLGYAVLLASDGVEAVAIHQARAATIDCILLDLSMPNLSGREALTRIREVDPDTPVLLWTGYDLSGAVDNAEAIGAQGVLRKPLKRKELADAIAKLLRDDG